MLSLPKIAGILLEMGRVNSPFYCFHIGSVEPPVNGSVIAGGYDNNKIMRDMLSWTETYNSDANPGNTTYLSLSLRVCELLAGLLDLEYGVIQNLYLWPYPPDHPAFRPVYLELMLKPGLYSDSDTETEAMHLETSIKIPMTSLEHIFHANHVRSKCFKCDDNADTAANYWLAQTPDPLNAIPEPTQQTNLGAKMAAPTVGTAVTSLSLFFGVRGIGRSRVNNTRIRREIYEKKTLRHGR
ncbi:hypothetical protein FHL15_003808 [Xylaria flabelliformis]|uniref:Uncharacterized protein n=1 Tax=Xylaria flabelliformis TaxID=2512241 RepID=A0A553I4I0_9PEZI|nr:hypothetical protein FHL15_003808 [Xylaria flabelliformis]